SYKIVVDKSTVPVRTGDKVAETIKRYCKARVEFDVVSNPEFLREGFAVEDFMKPDRVVVGVRSPRPVQSTRSMYEPFNAPTRWSASSAKSPIRFGCSKTKPSASLDLPSSKTPMTFASRLQSIYAIVSKRKARACAFTIPAPWTRPAACSKMSLLSRI